MIAFAEPAYFGLGAVVLLMTAGAIYAGIWRRRAREAFAGPQAPRWGGSGFWVRSLMVVGAAALIAIATARPQWGTNETVRESVGVDYVIALDISKSMSAADVAPTRLEAAQEELIRLVESERGNRIGLVVFAGSAFLRSPLTSDTQAMTQLIRRADGEASLARVGSDLGAALEVASTILAASEPERGKAVILVSDGEDHAGSYVAQAELLAAQDITVLTAGVGTTSGALLYDQDAAGDLILKLDINGQPIVSRLDSSSLIQIAELTGGRYEQVTGARSLLSFQVDLQSLDSTPAGTEVSTVPVERYQILVAAAIALLLIAWFLPARVWLPRLRRARLHPALAMVLLAVALGACGGEDEESLRARNDAANALFAMGDYEAALALYQELLAERPDVDELSFNAGNTLHRLQSYERAIAATSRGLPPRDIELGVDTYYSLGNHLLRLGLLEEAYFAYRQALLLDPSDGDSKHNLELVLRLPSTGQPLPVEQPPGPDQTQSPLPGAPGDEVTPTPGEPQDPSGQPDTGGSPQPGTPQPGDSGDNEAPPGTPQATPQSRASIERSLAEALAGIDEEVSFEQAIEILDLLRQRQQTPEGVPGAPSTEPDY